MKLSITQAVLGAIIVLAACCIIGWMIFGVSSLLNMPVPDESGVMRNTDVFPEHETLFAVARYASGLLLGLGLVVLLTGALWKRAESSKKLAITQIIGGMLITIVSLLITTRGYPTVFIIPMPAGGNLLRSVYINPGPTMVFAVFLTAITCLLGLAVLGTGTAQLIKTGKEG